VPSVLSFAKDISRCVTPANQQSRKWQNPISKLEYVLF
jgi:hypothetical protein